MITIILVDDHPVVRRGIRSVIDESDHIKVVGEASNGIQAIDLIKELKPNVVVTDITMPKMNGIELTSRISDEFPETKVLFLTMHMEAEYVFKGFESGAFSYLQKDADQKELFEAIESVSKGVRYLTREVNQIYAQRFVKNLNPLKSNLKLTKRELEVLKLLVSGLRNKDIAEELNLSVRTIDTHRFNIMKKLNVGNAAELVQKAIEQGLV
ncbi:MAG: response regulator [Bacteroidota bacterium]